MGKIVSFRNTSPDGIKRAGDFRVDPMHLAQAYLYFKSRDLAAAKQLHDALWEVAEELTDVSVSKEVYELVNTKTPGGYFVGLGG